ADVFARVAQVQGVRTALAAVAEHGHRFAEPRRAVRLVVDLHSHPCYLLTATGPLRVSSRRPCPFNSSISRSAAVSSPVYSNTIPFPFWRSGLAPASASTPAALSSTR